MFKFSTELIAAWTKSDGDRDMLIARAGREAVSGKVDRKTYRNACREQGLVANTVLLNLSFSLWTKGECSVNGVADEITSKRIKILTEQKKKREDAAKKKAREAELAAAVAAEAEAVKMNPDKAAELAKTQALETLERHIEQMEAVATQALQSIKKWKELASLLPEEEVPSEQMQEVLNLVKTC